MEAVVDIITVFHNEKNHIQALDLVERIRELEGDKVAFHLWDNRVQNLGFAAACNKAVNMGSAPIVGFINPDVEIHDEFIDAVLAAFQPTFKDDHPVIVGTPFNKPSWEWESWGCKRWVCGAFMFVRRDWFLSVGGFDERFVWSWEETDLIRRAEREGKRVVPLRVGENIRHDSPTDDTKVDSEYKRYHFNNGARLFREKWLT